MPESRQTPLPTVSDLAAELGLSKGELYSAIARAPVSYRREHSPNRKILQVPDSWLLELQTKVLLPYLRTFLASEDAMTWPGHGSREATAIKHAKDASLCHIGIIRCYESFTYPECFSLLWPGLLSSVSRLDSIAPLLMHRGRAGVLSLPNGAPTSPAVLDISLRPVDSIGSLVSSYRHGHYSRYIDTIYLSVGPEEDISEAMSGATCAAGALPGCLEWKIRTLRPVPGSTICGFRITSTGSISLSRKHGRAPRI